MNDRIGRTPPFHLAHARRGHDFNVSRKDIRSVRANRQHVRILVHRSPLQLHGPSDFPAAGQPPTRGVASFAIPVRGRTFIHQRPTEVRMSYHLEGRLLEVCNCRVLCPCWIGEDPDFGTCDTIIAWRVDKGTVDGVEVGGNTIAAVAHVPGNILEGNWTAAIFVDDKASKAQEDALLKVYTGQAGGPVADLAKLIGTVVSVERAPIRFDIQGGKGTLEIGKDYYAELEPYVGAMGATTTLTDTSSRPCRARPCSSARRPYRSKNAAIGIDVDIKNHNALQSTFVFDA